MNLTKLIKGLEKEMAPLAEERDKMGCKIEGLERKYEDMFDAIQALRNAALALEDIKNREDD